MPITELTDERWPGPAKLIEDLEWLLDGKPLNLGPQPTSYERLLQAMVRSRRWRTLDAQVRRCRRSIRKGTTASGQLARQRAEAQAASIRTFALRSLAYRLVHFALGAQPDAAVDTQQIGDGFDAWQGQNEPIIDAYVLVGAAIAMRAKMDWCLDLWLNRELIVACLRGAWDREPHEPRPLLVIPQEGERQQRLPGDQSWVRAITTKQREDQLKDVLTPEWALCFEEGIQGLNADGVRNLKLEATARTLGLDHIVNGKPLIWEHHLTRRPMVRQRILCLIVVGAEQRGESAPAREAHVRARRLAFRLLVTAALQVPHEVVEVEVAWLERRDDQWTGGSFPLQSLSVDPDPAESWQNVAAVDRLLPHLFVRGPEGEAARVGREHRILREAPSVCIERLVGSRLFHGVTTAVVMRNEERALCLPSPAMPLPRLGAGANTVLLTTVAEDEDAYRGAGFRDLVSAGVAGLPLPPAAEDELIRTFMTMLIGPSVAKGGSMRGR
jgi:hypothetical protein